MKWFTDVLMLFGEWLLIMLIPLLLGIWIGWLLWYRKAKRLEVEKTRVTKELTTSRAEKDALALSRSEELQALKNRLKDCRDQGDIRVKDKQAELDKVTSDYAECQKDNERLDLAYKEEIRELKTIIEVETNKNVGLEAAIEECKEENAAMAKTIAMPELTERMEPVDDVLGQEGLDELEEVEVEVVEGSKAIKAPEAIEAPEAPKERVALAEPEQLAMFEDGDDAFAKQLALASAGMVMDYEDDLKEISGVGPKMEKLLKDFGIKTFYQLSKFDAKGIAALNDKLDAFPGRIERDNWVGQAKDLYDKHH